MYSNIDEIPQSIQDYSDSFLENNEQMNPKEEWQYYVSPDAVGADAPNFECEDLPW